jgi:hypothetical protein
MGQSLGFECIYRNAITLRAIGEGYPHPLTATQRVPGPSETGEGERTLTPALSLCAETRVELDQWARQNVGGELHPCGLCRPE